LVIQVKENFHTGKHTRIGEVFLKQGLMERSHIDEVLQTKAKAVGKKGNKKPLKLPFGKHH
jgi:hypothetical protein